MARLLADEDVYADLRRRLTSHGHDVLTVQDLGWRSAGDHSVLLRAFQLNRLVITHNYDDYALLHQAWISWSQAWGVAPPPNHAGVLAVPQRDLLGAEITAMAVTNLLGSRPSIPNELLRLRRNGEWIDHSPTGREDP